MVMTAVPTQVGGGTPTHSATQRVFFLREKSRNKRYYNECWLEKREAFVLYVHAFLLTTYTRYYHWQIVCLLWYPFGTYRELLARERWQASYPGWLSVPSSYYVPIRKRSSLLPHSYKRSPEKKRGRKGGKGAAEELRACLPS